MCPPAAASVDADDPVDEDEDVSANYLFLVERILFISW